MKQGQCGRQALFVFSLFGDKIALLDRCVIIHL